MNAQKPDRHELQANGKHPAPCAKFCEATAFTIELRRAQAEVARLRVIAKEAAEYATKHQTEVLRLQAQLAAAQGQDLLEIMCARIKAADDAMADGNYMLDSDDCISVIRGTWKPPMLNDKPAAPIPQPPAPSDTAITYMTGYSDGREWAAAQLAAAQGKSPQAWTNVLAYALQDDLHNRLTPRVIDIAYNAFMQAKQPNKEDGGASDWFNDTKPMVNELIARLRKDLVEEFGDAPIPQLPAPSDAAREYMTGYSDAKEWAQPERAEDSVNAKRYLWLRDEAYSAGGKTPFIVIGRDDSNCYVVSGTTADEAIDAAIKQGGQHD